jgi:hypothetical protein
MADPVAVQARPNVVARLGAFVVERYPVAVAAVSRAVAFVNGAGASDATDRPAPFGSAGRAARAALQT